MGAGNSGTGGTMKTMKQVSELQKQLSSAKRDMTRKYNEYLSARGLERNFDIKNFTDENGLLTEEGKKRFNKVVDDRVKKEDAWDAAKKRYNDINDKLNDLIKKKSKKKKGVPLF